jgi:propionate CoA-transferase
MWFLAACAFMALGTAVAVTRNVIAVRKGEDLALHVKVRFILNLIRFRMHWADHDSKAHPSTFLANASVAAKVKASPMFMSADAIAAQIPDGSVVLTGGFASSERAALLFWAVSERFAATQHPRELTWLSVSAQGTRGKAPGSADDLAAPGLLKRYITGHLETVRAILRAGEAGTLELYNMPQGRMAACIALQQDGTLSHVSSVGSGTYLDPRCGSGGRMNSCCTTSFISSDAKDADKLRYSLPPINICMFNARMCDVDGNIYLHENTTITECIDGAKAAKRHGGKVFVCVQNVLLSRPVEADDRLLLPARYVDGICVLNQGPQTDPVGLRTALLPNYDPASVPHAWNTLRFMNRFLRITPTRTNEELALGKMGASLLEGIWVHSFKKRAEFFVNIGIGLPEEVGTNLLKDPTVSGHMTLCTESGALGGIPAMGIFFGCSISPRKIITSHEMFTMLSGSLDITCLGALEIDRGGNVNVSHRGPAVTDLVGCGGFSDLVNSAKAVVFLSAWMKHGQIRLVNGGSSLKVVKVGKPKFVQKCREITFCAQEALKLGKEVWYCTNVGVFKLSCKGLVLRAVVAGVDVSEHILNFAPFPLEVDPNLVTIPANAIPAAVFQ